MSKVKKKERKIDPQKELNFLKTILVSIFLLLLSLFNLQLFGKDNKVLGSSTEDQSEYWKELTAKHPDYIDGWLELGRIDKVKEIDPNYFK